MSNNEQKELILAAVNQASAKWKAAFNAGDAAGCASQYETEAVMHTRPFGTFTGAAENSIFLAEFNRRWLY